jgi:hypothetical protein
MRRILVALILLAAGSMIDRAAADPYRWCVEYPGRGAAIAIF